MSFKCVGRITCHIWIHRLGCRSKSWHCEIVKVMLVLAVGLLNSCWQTAGHTHLSVNHFDRLRGWHPVWQLSETVLLDVYSFLGMVLQAHTHTQNESTDMRINMKCLRKTWQLVRTRKWKCVRVWVRQSVIEKWILGRMNVSYLSVEVHSHVIFLMYSRYLLELS